jgi:pimeloyl-ACP methyl ester carboxylesterase
MVNHVDDAQRVKHIEVTGADGVRLRAWEFLGAPPGRAWGRPAPERVSGRPRTASAVLFLHGLMGRASHWAATARRLAPHRRAVALDQRGHGASGKPDGPCGSYSRDAYVADAEAAVEQLGLAPVVLVGHSMGALNAWQLAARRPDLVAALVICDMRASAIGEARRGEWEAWFGIWPVPFADRAEARRWFGADDPTLDRPRPARGDFFADALEERADGWHPVFCRRHMLRSLDGWISDSHWDELAQVRCPSLVARGLDGLLGRAEAQEMVRVLPRGSYGEIADAGHFAPWEQPDAWYDLLEDFLLGLEPGPA